MTQTALAVVIGGGIMGSCLTYFLTAGGMKGVAMLEADTIGSGITGKSVALVRMHYADPFDTELAVKSYDLFQRWADLTGEDSGFRTTGFLFIVGPWDVEKLRRNTEMVRSFGVRTEVLGTEDVKQFQPLFSVDDIGAAAYEPDSGYADGWLSSSAMARRSRELGASVRQGVRVTEVLTDGGKVTGVKTDGGVIETPLVILAAGAWSKVLARTAGVELPITGMRLAAGVLEWPPQMKEPHLACIDRVIGTYLRPESGDLTIVGAESPRPGGPDYDPDDYPKKASLDEQIGTLRRIMRRIPAYEQAGWRDSFAAVDSATEDGHAILGPTPLEGLHVAVGLSGTGFKVAPAAGQALAELILQGRSRTVDLAPYRMSRFEEGKPLLSETEYTFGPDPAEEVA